jgi:hypothetical protein
MAGILPPVTGADIGATGDEWEDVYLAGQMIDADENAVSVADIAGHIAETTEAHGGIVASTDARLTNARTPIAHASTHQSGGTDAIKLDDLAAPDDNTDLNASISKHGLLPKLGGGTTNYLRADGSWATPPSGSATSATTTIAVGDWSGNVCTKSLSGVTASNHIVVGPAPSSADAYGAARIIAATQGAGTITFGCTTTPTGSIAVNVLIFG